jgi:hypothetical protein
MAMRWPLSVGETLTLHGAGPLVKSLLHADFRGADSERLGDIALRTLTMTFAARSRFSGASVPVKRLHA